jgi:hypothetical protein
VFSTDNIICFRTSSLVIKIYTLYIKNSLLLCCYVCCWSKLVVIMNRSLIWQQGMVMGGVLELVFECPR